MQDRNFDDIAEKFSRNIYGTTKGQLRQAILWQDLQPLLDRLGPGHCEFLTRAAAKGRRRSKWRKWGITSRYAISLVKWWLVPGRRLPIKV